VLITYLTMLFLYDLLACWEETHCLAQYGESYRAYQAQTGRFLPLAWSRRLPRLPSPSQRRGALTALGVFVLLLSASVALGFTLRDYSLSSITAFYTPEATVLSPALLRDKEIVKTAYGLHPIVLVQVDISALEVTGMETPPPHVVWGDIPTPLF
jgi:hypothetical protein